MADEKDAKKPDFKDGFSAKDIPDGGMVQGQFIGGRCVPALDLVGGGRPHRDHATRTGSNRCPAPGATAPLPASAACVRSSTAMPEQAWHRAQPALTPAAVIPRRSMCGTTWR